MLLIFPANQSSFSDANGAIWTPDANGMVDIGPADPTPFLAAGFVTLPDNVGPTSARPTTGITPGRMYFDTTLNKPVWRNAANGAWVDATGASA